MNAFYGDPWRTSVFCDDRSRISVFYDDFFPVIYQIEKLANKYTSTATAKQLNLNFQLLEVVSCCRDTQLQVTKNACDFWNLGPNIYQC